MLSVFTNMPNPYNGHLYAALRAQGERVVTTYKGDPASQGRPWQIDLAPDEHVSSNVLSDIRGVLQARRSTVLLTGGYIGAEEVSRRLLAPRVGAEVWFWGERFRPRRLLEPYRRWYFRTFQGVLAVGSWARADYRMVVGPQVPVHVLPYTTTAARPPRDAAPRPLLGYAGSLIPRKGVDIVLRGLAAIPAGRRPDLEVVGSGPERVALERLAADAGVRVEWLGEVTTEELDRRRSRWWAQVVPSRYDGWGVVVSEALASGVPVVVSPYVGAGIDLVRTGYNGTCVAGDGDWAEAMARYCDDALVEREGRRARVVGEEMAAEKAAPWLADVLGHGGGAPARSFVAEAWDRALARVPS